MLYCAEARGSLAQGLTPPEQAKQLGAQWKSLDPGEKSKFLTTAKATKEAAAAALALAAGAAGASATDASAGRDAGAGSTPAAGTCNPAPRNTTGEAIVETYGPILAGEHKWLGAAVAEDGTIYGRVGTYLSHTCHTLVTFQGIAAKTPTDDTQYGGPCN
jgi:hypothetical protein